jgi:hypothetical protein
MVFFYSACLNDLFLLKVKKTKECKRKMIFILMVLKDCHFSLKVKEKKK